MPRSIRQLTTNGPAPTCWEAGPLRVLSADETRIDEDRSAAVHVRDVPFLTGCPVERTGQGAGDEHERPWRNQSSAWNPHVRHRGPSAVRVVAVHGCHHQNIAFHDANLWNNGNEPVRQDALHDRSGGGSAVVRDGAEVVRCDGAHHDRHTTGVFTRDAVHEDVLHVAQHLLVPIVPAALPHAGANGDGGQEEGGCRLQGEILIGPALLWRVAEELFDDSLSENRPFAVGRSGELDDRRSRRFEADELLSDEDGRWRVGLTEGVGIAPSFAFGLKVAKICGTQAAHGSLRVNGVLSSFAWRSQQRKYLILAENLKKSKQGSSERGVGSRGK